MRLDQSHENSQNPEKSQTGDHAEVDELGFLDYMEIGENANSVMMATLSTMTSAIEELGGKMRERPTTAENLAKSPSVKAAKELANASATDLDAYTKRTAAEVPVFSESYADVLRAFSGAASIVVESQGGHDQVRNALAQTEQLRVALETSREQLREFAENLRSTPRMTSHLNRAKNKALNVLAFLDDEFGKARSLSLMVEDSIRNLLK